MAEIKDVEIFQEGVWNGNQITADMLASIVDSFEKTKGFFEPPLKLGHGDDQEFLKKEGLPAAGWVSNLKIKGKKLLADFSMIPEKIADLIKKKRYRKVSIELFKGLKLKGHELDHFLGAVALLGADIPAVLSLADIPTDFKQRFTADADLSNMSTDVISHEIKQKDLAMPDEKTEKNPAPDYQKTIDELKSQIENLKDYNKKTETEMSDLRKKAAAAALDKFAIELKSKEIISPGMEPLVRQLAAALPSEEKYSVGDKKVDAHEMITSLLTLAKEAFSVNLSDKTVDAKKEDKNSFSAINEKIEKYALDNKVSYAEAYKRIVKD